jgi:hypothetical protein
MFRIWISGLLPTPKKELGFKISCLESNFVPDPNKKHGFFGN